MIRPAEALALVPAVYLVPAGLVSGIGDANAVKGWGICVLCLAVALGLCAWAGFRILLRYLDKRYAFKRHTHQ